MCKHATHSLALFKHKYTHVLVLALTHTYTHYLSFFVFASISGSFHHHYHFRCRIKYLQFLYGEALLGLCVFQIRIQMTCFHNHLCVYVLK